MAEELIYEAHIPPQKMLWGIVSIFCLVLADSLWLPTHYLAAIGTTLGDYLPGIYFAFCLN